MPSKNKQTTIGLLLAFLLCGGMAFFIPRAQADDANPDDIQHNIDKTLGKLEDAQKKQESLAQELANINSSLSATQQTIAQTQLKIKQAEVDIDRKQDEIELLQEQTDQQKLLLSGLVQDLYAEKDISVPRVLLASNDFSDYINHPANLMTVQEKITSLLSAMKNTKNQTESEKANLENLETEHERLLAGKIAEKANLAADQQDTASDLDDQATVVKRLSKELSELQGDLSKLTGKSYNAADIKEAVSFASKETGVPKGFLIGVLKMETNLGANVGGCTYSQVESGAEANYKKGKLSKTSWNTFKYRRTLFKQITDELDLDYKKQKVSCNPSGYTGTGGAMGVAQFMPDTWMGYRSAVIAHTGHNPPSPWSLTDGVMAMALKLDRVPGVDDGKESAYRAAATAYLGTSYKPYIDGILYWAKHYKELL